MKRVVKEETASDIVTKFCKRKTLIISDKKAVDPRVFKKTSLLKDTRPDGVQRYDRECGFSF